MTTAAAEHFNPPSSARWWSTGSGLIELAILPEHVAKGYHQGACDADVADLRTAPYLKAQLDALAPLLVAEELAEYGAWDAAELARSHDENLSRLLWIACGDLFDEAEDTTDELED